MKTLFQFRALEAIAFTSGFALMAFELVAARILAPYIGSSMYVWTSVIGVIIASLSLGYYAGGRLADKHSRLSDIAWLCLIAGLAVVIVMLSYQPVLEWIAKNIADPRLQGTVASLLLFAPTSFLIGIKAPYLAKLKVTSLEHTGQSVASLSAVNAVGGIVGVFVSGFVLFSYIGSWETLAVIVLLLIISSWLVVPRRRTALRAFISVFLLLASVVPANAKDSVVTVDTPTAHYQVIEGYIKNQPKKIRALTTGPAGAQSGVYADGDDGLVFWYTQELARVVEMAPQKGRILILGGGTFTLPSYLAKRYPASKVDVVEIDPELEKIAARYFHYAPQPNLTIIFSDARNYVNTTKASYDIILADVYSDTNVPFSLMTKEYGKKVAGILKPNGLLAANVIAAPAGPCRQLFSAVNAAYVAALPHGVYKRDPGASSRRQRTNIIAVYTRKESAISGYQALPRIDAVPYADNYMPAERLQRACREGDD